MKNGTSFASCGEDRSLRVWNLDAPDECQQTVFLPAQSVWTVAVMDNNDIVTGSRFCVLSHQTEQNEEFIFFRFK